MVSLLPVLSSLLLVMAAFDPIQALEFYVFNNASNTPGGIRFEKEIGDSYAVEVLNFATMYIWSTFKELNHGRKPINEVTLTVELEESLGNGWIGYTEGNHIHLNSYYIADYVGDVRFDIIGELLHQTTHVWQWKGDASTPTGLIEGIADYMRLKAGLAPPRWSKIGSGTRWDEGYEVTAYFLDYCNGLKRGFVARLNYLMKDGYSEEFFVQLLGKTVDELWKDYKIKYGSV